MESVIGKFLQFPEGFGDPLLQGRSQFLLKDPGSQGGHAALAAEIGFAQGDCAEMDLASEKLQNGDGGGGESRGDVGLKAQLPHPPGSCPGWRR